MRDIKAIVNGFHKVDTSLRKAAIATVVKVRGSSYRCPGARMLITDDGRWVGSISGGCLEGDALRKARAVMSENKPIIVTYDTREESNQNLGISLGCNGVIDILIEPIDNANQKNTIGLFEQLYKAEESFVLATVFNDSSALADKAMINENGLLIKGFENSSLTEIVISDLLELFVTKKSVTRIYDLEGNIFEVFLELIQPSIKLIIFGAGFDARPVCDLAKSIGWEVQVTDECAAHIAPVFFPVADKLMLCERKFIDQSFAITPFTACVLMSHNYEFDRDVLRKLITTSAAYIGILGPKKRVNKMEEEFQKEGIYFNEELLKRLHSPIGLDIGAETPSEIAISIIAEINSKFSNRVGGFLKDRNAPIHDRVFENDQVLKQVYVAESNKSL